MTNGRILWADDEMELLRPHLLFLERKGYDVVTATNGTDAVELCQQQQFDVILLDEMMPGITGLQALERIKLIQPTVPVVMVTKSEEENIMNEAVGRNIADYFIKPVNPNQILLSLKKLIHRKELVAETTQTAYQQHFQQISMQMMDCCCWNDWAALYRQLVDWELKLVSADPALADMLRMQKAEANLGFAKFVKRNYVDWMQHHDFTMNHDVMQHHILPMLKQGERVFLVVFDNFRYDQWKAIETELTDYDIAEQLCCSILPTATQYARNALFAGMMPSEIKQRYPDWWTEEDAEAIVILFAGVDDTVIDPCAGKLGIELARSVPCAGERSDLRSVAFKALDVQILHLPLSVFMYGKIFDLVLIISVIYNTILTGKLQVRHEKIFLAGTVLSHKTT